MAKSLDPAANPYTPGAGIRPPVLVGRELELDDASKLLTRLGLGYVEPPRLIEGVRGVGKTVLLLAIRDRMRQAGGLAVHVQARREGVLRPLAEELRHELARSALTGSAITRVREAVGGLTVTAGGVGLSVRGQPDDSANPTTPELLELFQRLSELPIPSVLTIDEVQEMPRRELSALLVALQRAAGDGYPIGVIAAGLPGTLATLAATESFAERMFRVAELGPLDPAAAARAVIEPAEERQVRWSQPAVDLIVQEAAGYPYFLQHFASSTWDVAVDQPVSVDDASRGVDRSEGQLARSLVAARIDRLSERERAYVEAMAALGHGPHRSGAIAAQMGTTSDQVGSARQRLISAGVIFAPSYGHVDFTVPLFARLLARHRS